MEINALTTKYPKLYHISEIRNWDLICKHGLLSTTALLDLFEYQGHKRFEIESNLRAREICITHPVHGEAVIRDQAPMQDRSALEKSLVGLSAQQWFELLNKKTFFWTDSIGLNRMLGAKLYQSRTHYVFTVNTQKLINRYADKLTLCPFNSGSLYGKNAEKQRSINTFRPISHHSEPWATELAVEYSVPDIFDLTICVDECISETKNGEKICRTNRHIWPQ